VAADPADDHLGSRVIAFHLQDADRVFVGQPDPRLSGRRNLMHTWIALFRSINVGGHNLLPMAALRRELESLPLSNVRTCIQSGNVVFESESNSAELLASRIATCIEANHGFKPQLLLLSPKQLQAAVDANPFGDCVDTPKTLHFFFLAEPATIVNTKGLDEARSPTERYCLTASVFYLHAPEGIGRSKLARKAPDYLGVLTTARTYTTVEKLLSMVAVS
jgi:uncharacterized protein (DUF1697 family)